MYIVLISMHGLIRSEDMELGRDADTGGQIKYVIELARALSKHPKVSKVDLLTRKVIDPKVSSDYSYDKERLNEKASIVRIECGPKRYLRKEVLWPYIENFIDSTIKYIRKEGVFPDFVHGHYADAGMVASRLSYILEIPMVFTGHSMGKVKLQRLLEKKQSHQSIEIKYNITQRIEAEEIALAAASLVVTSTKQEITEQYSTYANSNSKLMKVIPPGVDMETLEAIAVDSAVKEGLLSNVNRFFQDCSKPLILSLSRADERKNIAGLIHAYGKSKALQKAANLLIIAGSREEIAMLDSGAKKVISDMLMLVDKYDLYGKVAYPKSLSGEEIPYAYIITRESKGVFINPALTEPFGLTLIEAGALGVPVVSTNDGGPNDIIGNTKMGELVDPLDGDAIETSLLNILNSDKRWNSYHNNGIQNTKRYYTWDAHVESYIDALSKIKTIPHTFDLKPLTKILSSRHALVSDIDNTLIGKDNSKLPDLVSFLDSRDDFLFGIATGRTYKSALAMLKRHNVPIPDIMITSVGSEIYYGKRGLQEKGWKKHISFRWERARIIEVLKEADFLKYQPESEQSEFKISYFAKGKNIRNRVRRLLRENKLVANIIYSHGEFVDILPIRASKGHAIRYVAFKWGLPFENIIVSGDSGNDEGMLKGDMKGVVVADYSKELEKLKERPSIYFASKVCAGGVMEGIEFFLGKEDE